MDGIKEPIKNIATGAFVVGETKAKLGNQLAERVGSPAINFDASIISSAYKSSHLQPKAGITLLCIKS